MVNRRIFLEKLFLTTTIATFADFIELNNIALADTKNIFNFVPSLIYEIVGPIVNGIGEGVGDLLKDWVDSHNPYKIQQRQEIIDLFKQTLKEYQNHQIDLKLLEIQGNWDQENWSGILSRNETKTILQTKETLLLLVAPPNMSSDVPSLIRNNLASDFRTIPTELRKFYSESSNDYKVKIYTDYFKNTIGDITVKQLHGILSPIPTAIFYTDINDYTCQFNVGFWGLKSSEPKIISGNLWNWKNTVNVLQQAEVNQENCLIKIRELIVTLNQLLASYLIDISFLKINPLYELKFPEFSQKLLAKQFDQKAVNAVYIDTLKQRQAEQITTLDNFKSQIQQVNNAIVEGAGKWKMYKAWFTYSPVYSLAINSAESMIVSEKKGDLVFSNFDGNSIQQTKFTYNGHSNINGLKFSNTGKSIIYGDSFGHITAFVRDRNKNTVLYRHYGRVNSITIHPHENIIASGGDDRKVNIFNFDNRKMIGSHKMESAVLSVEFSPDGQLLAMATKEGYIHLGSLYRQKILTFQENHSVLCVKFTLDGKILVTGDSNRNIVLWDVKTGSLIRNLKGHSSSVNSLVFSKDGSTLFSASADSTIKLWNWKTGDCVRTLTLNGGVDSFTCLALSSDGHTLVSGSKDATIAVWRDMIA